MTRSGLRKAIVLLAALTVAVPARAQAPDVMARGRTLTRLFFTSQLDSLHETFNPQMSGFLDLRNLNIYRDQVAGQIGSETTLLEERVTARESLQAYTRLGLYDKADGLIEVVWTVDSQGRVAGFSMRAPQSAHPSRFDDYRTRTPLRLPFAGPWFVIWGGRSLKENRHAASPDERFGTDFILRRGTASHAGDGATNAQYYAFDQPVVAPGPGTVVLIVNDVEDNLPGTPNRDQLLGNHVVIDHGNGEFSFLGHLERGSITVRKGQKVKAGQPLARCGNSGYSTEPQLHYHLQTTGKRFAGEGLPAQFSGYRAEGAVVDRGEPQQLQTVEQP